jgi:hypothetical protein
MQALEGLGSARDRDWAAVVNVLQKQYTTGRGVCQEGIFKFPIRKECGEVSCVRLRAA